MNKSEFVEKLSQKGNFSHQEAEKILNAFLDSVEDALCKDGTLALRKFGTFSVRTRKERTGRHPVSGEAIQISASKTVSFSPSTDLKACVTKSE